MKPEDAGFGASLHAQSLGHGFFPMLGAAFMRAYYLTFIESPHALALTATVRGDPVGFLVGVLRPWSHARWLMRRRGVGLALRGAAALAVRPRTALIFVQSRMRRYTRAWRRYRGAASGRTAEPAPGIEPAVLSHVAILPGARGTGAGSKLVRAFELTATAAGARSAALTTLEGADGAGGFYSKLGWTLRATHRLSDGVCVEEWRQTLEHEAPLEHQAPLRRETPCAPC